jgi:hypothetical protein
MSSRDTGIFSLADFWFHATRWFNQRGGNARETHGVRLGMLHKHPPASRYRRRYLLPL